TTRSQTLIQVPTPTSDALLTKYIDKLLDIYPIPQSFPSYNSEPYISHLTMAAVYEPPAIFADKIRPHARDLLQKVYTFVHEECIPADALYIGQQPSDPSQRFHTSYPPILDELKAKAKSLGLWNLFLSKRHYVEGVDL